MGVYAKGFVLKLKLGTMVNLQTIGHLEGIHKTLPKQATTKLLTPDTDEAVKQFYVAESLATAESVPASKLFTKSQCKTANVVQDNFTKEVTTTVLDKEQLDEIATSNLPKNVMNLTVHHVQDVDKIMFPAKDGQSYVFYPDANDPDNLQNYQILYETLTRGGLAMCSVVNLQNHENLYRLQAWRDRIILVRQNYPDQIAEHNPPVEGEHGTAIPEGFIDKFLDGFQKLAEPIEATTYRDRILSEKVALSGAEVTEVLPKEDVDPVANLEALLGAFE